MKTRTITGFFFLIVMIGSFLLGHYVFGAFYLALSAFCLYEFYSLITQNTAKPNIPAGLLTGVLIYAAFALLTYGMPLGDTHAAKTVLFLIPLASASIFIWELFRRSAAPFTNIAYTYVGLLFTIIPFTFFHGLAYLGGEFNFHVPLAFMIFLWSNDTGAYLVGSKMGKHKLFERHSPKKTWEGFIGGILISAVAALIINHYYKELLWYQWVIMAFLISCFGTAGDLGESMLKRSINVKDSGGILPGHGGLLDRFDGLLIAAPIVYTYLYFISNY